MQQNDGFEADNKTAPPLLWCTDKSVSTIPLYSTARISSGSQCHMDLEENSKCQAAKGQGQPANRVKISPLYSLSLVSVHNCAFLFCSAVCLGSKLTLKDHKRTQRITNRGVQQLPSGARVCYLSHWGVEQRLCQTGGRKGRKILFTCGVN